jgi:hypothetical protein
LVRAGFRTAALLAWEDIQEEASELKLEDLQQKQLAENQARLKRDLKESV